jgi:hypothetical protein
VDFLDRQDLFGRSNAGVQNDASDSNQMLSRLVKSRKKALFRYR